MTHFFFITSYDSISGKLLSSILNSHPDIGCHAGHSDTLVPPSFYSNQVFPPPIHSYPALPFNISVDKYILCHTDLKKKYSGDAHYFSAMELQHKTLMEKTIHPYRKVNLLISPILRVNLILHNWMQSNLTPGKLLTLILNQMNTLKKAQHRMFSLYNFDYFYKQLQYALPQDTTDYDYGTSVKNKLFLIALAKVLAYDSADIPTASKAFRFEALLENEKTFMEFFHYLTYGNLDLPPGVQEQIASQRRDAIQLLDDMLFPPWASWQTHLLTVFLNKRLHTIYYPHIDKPLAELYSAAGYELSLSPSLPKQKSLYSKLISLQLNSNRPAQLSAYFDNIEETADNPQDIEVLVNIDKGDNSMRALLETEIPRRKFTLKYIETARPASFCDLWKPINKLFEITDPDCYFLLNISDEMLFKTVGWDTILKKYVGYFPDHLFRLRASRNKFRNYFDRWECSFAQDAIPITTKKWIDVNGDWNPCFGPDSFQQLVSFYLSKESMFSNECYLRDIPLAEIQFAGDVPAIGISANKLWQHTSDHIKAMEICQSYKMQLEARRRAILIKANIYIHHQLGDYTIRDIAPRKAIHIIDNKMNVIIKKWDYKVSRLNIGLINYWRRLFFFSYFGEGKKQQQVPYLRGLARYLCAKYKLMHALQSKIRSLKFIKIKPIQFLKIKWQNQLSSLNTIHALTEENNTIKALLNDVFHENKKLIERVQYPYNPSTPLDSPRQENSVSTLPDHPTPKISIVIGVLNMKKYLANALDSVISQNYPHLEIIVIDGGSVDGTLDIIKNYEPYITYWISEKDDGHADACNKAIDIATGDFIGFLNADDTYDITLLNKVAYVYSQQPNAKMISCGASIIKQDENHRPQTIETLVDREKLQISLHNMMFELPVINARFFHRDLFKEFGKFQPLHEDGSYNLANDRHFLIKLALAGIQTQIIPEPLYQYLSHNQSSTFSKINMIKIRHDHLKLANIFLNDKTLSSRQRKIFKSWIKKDTIYLFMHSLLHLNVINAFSILLYGLKKCGLTWLTKLPLTIIVSVYRKTLRLFT
ncbi:MAG: PGL/p-HBAD biosynthesis glycosyltransferase [Gammaproteobacteria bacterium]|jgi:glycosyltransferase involved in cell wall biosynthesis|nr:PGL/p-HBAD biosynthesis glycosyltransferase [Gammaproteobacteria bacterium]